MLAALSRPRCWLLTSWRPHHATPQGFEVSVLRGARKLLAAQRVAWLFLEFDALALRRASRPGRCVYVAPGGHASSTQRS